jgi:hypothetical protein
MTFLGFEHCKYNPFPRLWTLRSRSQTCHIHLFRKGQLFTLAFLGLEICCSGEILALKSLCSHLSFISVLCTEKIAWARFWIGLDLFSKFFLEISKDFASSIDFGNIWYLNKFRMDCMLSSNCNLNHIFLCPRNFTLLWDFIMNNKQDNHLAQNYLFLFHPIPACISSFLKIS